MSTAVADLPVEYTARDAMLYALGIGIGSDPGNPVELVYVTEHGVQRTVPTMASMLANGAWLEDCGWDAPKVLHTEQGLALYRPLPPAARLLVNHRVAGVFDGGEQHGATIVVQSEARLARDDTMLFTLRSVLLARGDGGFGGREVPEPEWHVLPGREADLRCDLPTRPDQALLFRLSGDYNPLHSDPAFARRAGYDRPILHGRCTYGVACHAVLKTICDYDFTLIAGFDARFSAPVYPGDRITTEMWQDRNVVSFRCRVEARNAVVVDNGKCTLVG